MLLVIIILVTLVICLSYLVGSQYQRLSKSRDEFSKLVEINIEQAKTKEQEIKLAREQERELIGGAAKLAMQNWIFDNEKRIREDAIKKSQAITKGKVTEHIIPYFPEFKYDARDARFLGSPLDLIIFDGLSDGKLNSIILVEVKTGSSGLTERERQIKNIVDQKLVRYEVIRK